MSVGSWDILIELGGLFKSQSGGIDRRFEEFGAGCRWLAGAEKTAECQQGKCDGDAALYGADPVEEIVDAVPCAFVARHT